MNGEIIFDIKSFWHAGAGHGAGRFLDAVVVRSPAGLPFLPGKSVKGLLRQAILDCETWGHLDAGTTDTLFGTRGVGRFDTTPGALSFGDATLGKEWEAWARSEEASELLDSFYDVLSSTSLDEFRVAKEHTLRRSEVAIPLTLSARWSANEALELDAHAALELAAPLVRSLGSSRHRGLGRVAVSITRSVEVNS